MPLTKKGKEIMKSMKEQYGNKKGESIFYASKNKGTIKGVEKATLGLMMGKKLIDKSKEKTGTILPLGVAASLESNRKKLKYARSSTGKMMKVEKVKGALEKASKLHAAQAKTLGTVLKAAGGGLKEATKKLKAQGYKGGNMALKNPKKADLDKDGKLSSYERKRGKAIEDNMMKASVGMEAKSTRGYGAARTSGMGLEDQELPPGKSLDYYKDLM